MQDVKKILVIDDEEDICTFICDMAKTLQYDAYYTTNAHDIELHLQPEPDLIIMDLVMPDFDGIEVLRLLSQRKIQSGIILSSGFDSRVLKSAALFANELGLNVIGSLQKPFQYDQMVKLLNKDSTKTPQKKTSSFRVNEEKIDQGIVLRQFSAYYQPKISSATGAIAGFEALLRWLHPDEGMISPIDFIPLAEKSGQIRQLTQIVIQQGLDMLNRIKNHDKKYRLAINCPASLLNEIHFTDDLINTLHKANIEPDNIIIEVTESEVMNELSSSLDVMTRLRMKGVHLSIDDFGTGHSSMERLVSIPFTELKLDRSFVSDISDDSSRKIILNSIKLGHDLNMSVIAEGVEDRQTYDELAALGCDEIQGFYIGKPMPVESLLDWIHQYEMQQGKTGNCVPIHRIKR